VRQPSRRDGSAEVGRAALAAALLAAAPGLAQGEGPDVSHPLVVTVEGSRLLAADTGEIGAAPMLARPPIDKSPPAFDRAMVRLPGVVARFAYAVPAGRSAASMLAAQEKALAGRGFKTLARCPEGCPGAAGAELAAARTFGAFGRRAVEPGLQALSYLAMRHPDGTGFAMLAAEAPPGREGRMIVQLVEPAVAAAPTRDLLEKALAADGRAVLGGIAFQPGAAGPGPAAGPALAAVAALLKANPDLALIVSGHTADEGPFPATVALGQKRAAVVVAALTARGIAPDRLTAFGAGMATPLASNATEAGRARNRRVEIAIR
jgi:hypothetical protein